LDNKVYYNNGAVVIGNVRDFELKHIFECGQAFRWYEESDKSYTGVARGRIVNVSMNENTLTFRNTNIDEFNEIWYGYFDMDRGYGKIKEELSCDKVLMEAIKFGEGIRILRQDEWEILITFIISANNRIPMIKKAIKKISEKWGSPIEYNGQVYYTFPGPEILAEADVHEIEGCGTGFRAKYISETAMKVALKEIDLYNLKNIGYENARESLISLPGVGPKVSDCVLLFSMGYYEAFPVDIWVKRVMQYFYLAPDVSLPKIEKYAQDRFGKLSGFAQQYLFYYARDMKGKELIV
jgi:3-methyladenine DNA glycosylase/8-oxoguanine DNA glycosylase